MTSIFNYRLSFTLLATVWSFIFLFQIVVFHAIFSPINYNLNCPYMHSVRTTFQGNGLFKPPPFFCCYYLFIYLSFFYKLKFSCLLTELLKRPSCRGEIYRVTEICLTLYCVLYLPTFIAILYGNTQFPLRK